jgi:hypothetical protein
LALLTAVGLMACFASSAALAFTPKPGETLSNGTVVEGKCKGPVAGQDVVGEQWTVNTDDPQRIYAPGKTLAPMEIAPSLLPYGDFGQGREAIGAHSHEFPLYDYEHHLFDPRFSAQWGWHYVDQWAVNFQGGSEGYSYMRNNKPCAEQVAEDTSADTPGNDHVHPKLGSYAGAFPGESVSQGHGLALQRPGPYALDQWTLEVHYKKVSPAEFKAHPFLARALGETEGCVRGTRIFDENAIKEAEESPEYKGDPFESEQVKAAFIYEEGMEDDYRVAGPAPLTEWKAETYCLEGAATQFAVAGAQGQGSFSGDMSQWPTSPYINQYAVGSQLGLPGNTQDAQPGATASGPAAVLMGMRASLGGAAPASSYPSLSSLYAQTVDSAGNFVPGPAVNLLKQLGWPNAVARPLGAGTASVEDAGPPYPIVYPNATNEATVDQALQTGPVVLDTQFGANLWGVASSGHVMTIVGIDPQQPGSYIVDDPAGNYFSAPTGHYKSSSYGYGVDYPKAWVLAFATNTEGRGLIELGSRTSSSPPPSSNNTGPTGTPTNVVAANNALRASAAQIRSLLKGAIVPSGKSAHITSLKKRLGFVLNFHAPEAGVVTIGWYELPRGARLSTKTKPKPLLVARGQLSFTAAGTRTIAMHLTMAGSHLLKHAHQLTLTARGSFTPRGAASVTTTRTFVLKK